MARRQAIIVEGMTICEYDNSFKQFIGQILSSCLENPQDINFMLSPENLQLYQHAFTSKLFDSTNNYEIYEIMGDVSLNKFVVWYMYNRFPQILNTEGVQLIARLKIMFQGGEKASKISEFLGLNHFITAPTDQFINNRVSLYEDVCEAFIGCTEFILNKKYEIGYGFFIITRLLKSVFDKCFPDISLEYDKLYDSITRLKQYMDLNRANGFSIRNEINQTIRTQVQMYEVKIHLLYARTDIILSEARGTDKTQTEKESAELAIAYLTKNLRYLPNFRMQKPRLFENLTKEGAIIKEKQEKVNREYLIQTYKGQSVYEAPEEKVDPEHFDINDLYFTKPKNQFRSYKSTLLAMYCRKRNISGINTCLELNADATILDSDGSSILDLLYMGEKDEKIVEEITTILNNYVKKNKLKMQRSVYDYCYLKYDSEFFLKNLEKFDITEYQSLSELI